MPRFVRALAAAFLVSSVASAAGSPVYLTHQGRLLGGDDVPMTGTHKLTFTIYRYSQAPAAGTGLTDDSYWSDSYTVNVTGGTYALVLGEGGEKGKALEAAFFMGERFLAVAVDGVPLSPRQRIGTTPYAANAQNVTRGTTVLFDEVGHFTGPMDNLDVPKLGGLEAAKYLTAATAASTYATKTELAALDSATQASFATQAAALQQAQADAAARDAAQKAALQQSQADAAATYATKAATYDKAAADARFPLKEEVQKKITNACTAGSYVTSVNADGSLTCAPAPVAAAGPITGDGTSGKPLTIPTATTSTDGLLAKADKAKLDSLRNSFNITFEVKNINSGRRTIEPRFATMTQAQNFQFATAADYAGGSETWYADLPWPVPGNITWYTTPQVQQLNGRVSLLWTVGVGDNPHPTPAPQTRIAILMDCRGAYNMYQTTGSPTPNYAEPRFFQGDSRFGNFLIAGQQYGIDNYLDMGVLAENIPMNTCIGTRSIRVINLGPNRLHVQGMWAVLHGTEKP